MNHLLVKTAASFAALSGMIFFLSPSDARSSTADPCTIIPAKDLERIMHAPVSVGFSAPVPGVPGALGCSIGATGSNVGYQLMLIPTHNAASWLRNDVKESNGASRRETISGQPAEYNENMGKMLVAKGNMIIAIFGDSHSQDRALLTAALRHL